MPAITPSSRSPRCDPWRTSTSSLRTGHAPWASALGAGDSRIFEAEGDFVVRSQSAQHPFMIFSYMTGCYPKHDFAGDPDFVRVVAPAQQLREYVFLTDPTYPETHLVVTRQRERADLPFAAVELECAGRIGGFRPVGSDGRFEAAHVDLVRGNFEAQGNCDNGVQRMRSAAAFGVTVWGWGTPATSGGSCDDPYSGVGTYTCAVSYAFPGGESVRAINDVVLPPIPE
jgi:hypothetical protein